MNENLANEIRKTIENVKDMKTQVGGINNYLSILEGIIRADYQKQIDEAYQRGYDKGYADKTNNDEVCNELAKDIYQRGLNDAWEAARKIILNPEDGGLSLTDIFALFGHRSMQNTFKFYSVSEAINKLRRKAYEDKQKADDEIKVGEFSALIDYLSQFDESDAVKVKYVRQKIEDAIGQGVDWYERRKA